MHWNEIDIWAYIQSEQIPIIDLYFSKNGERYRSLGCAPCTGKIKSITLNIDEMKQGITIDTTQIQFQSFKREYVVNDAPGYKEFLKNMISDAANAEAALLIIDAKEGVKEQSKRHAYILSLLGIKKFMLSLIKWIQWIIPEKSLKILKRKWLHF